METYEYILQAVVLIAISTWITAGIIIGYKIFKSDKYLQVKQQYRNVEIAKADLKFEYKMAVLNYKSNRDTRQLELKNLISNGNFIDMTSHFGIIDDNNYLNGVYTEFNPDKPYIIVVGEIAIGKSQYSKVMSSWNKGVQYYSVQRFIDIPLEIRSRAVRAIIIRDIEQLEQMS